MSTECEGVYRFLDGEMSADEQGTFRNHLADCESCSHAFQESLQLELLGQMALEELPVAPPEPVAQPACGPWQRRKGWVAAAGALAAGLVAALLVPGLTQREGPRPEWFVSTHGRVLEARLTYGTEGVGYQSFVPDRGESGGGVRVRPQPVTEMARMFEHGDLHGVATAALLHGGPGQARAYLEQLDPSVERNCDLAVVALQEARACKAEELKEAHLKQTLLGQALELLDGVLEQVPDHPQALWNRALVLREMGLTLLAAESFEAVAKRGEPGWSTEAEANAARLREDTHRRARAWKEAFAATRDLMTDMGARLPLGEARDHPGIVRLAFYDAVRSATSRRDVLRLLPLAQALDKAYGGTVLSGYVWRVADRDFTRREPLARQYVRLARDGQPPDPEVLETLRRSGEEDLYLGALMYASTAGLPGAREAVVRVAGAQEDPWLRLVAEREQALLEQQAGTWWAAEERLLAARQACGQQGLGYRCLGFERELTDLYLGLHQPAVAFQHAWAGWQQAEEEKEWRFEQEFLQELADIARFQKSLASARAYLQESLLRMPEDCEQRTHVHRNLAQLEWEGFQPERARRYVERALECERPLGLTGAMVLSDLSRKRAQPRDADLLRRALSELRRAGGSSGSEALLLFIEGQFELSRDAEAGRALLWRAVELAERSPEDANARKARASAYAVLISEAARQGAWSDALALMGRVLRLEPVPRQCVLGVSVQHERTVVLALGPSGELEGSFEESRSRPLRESAAGLVPSRLLAGLGGCKHVDVLALPPVHGLTGLLPPDMAWSYRVGRAWGPPRAEPGPSRHLVVTDVAAPGSLGLERLEELKPPRVPDPWRVELRGDQATLTRVLEEMADASEVELHAHGMNSPAVSDASMVVLAPDRDGSYALTADHVRAARLRRAPLVLLATCSAAKTAPFPHESFSLPVAFIEAGARAVLASTVKIPDTAGDFFEAVRELIRAGALPSVALRDARVRWQKAFPADQSWLPHVLLFE